jgi:hypothetical protein
MSEWLYIAGLSVSFLLLFLFIFSVVRMTLTGKKLRTAGRIRPKNQAQARKLVQMKKYFGNLKKSQLKQGLLSLFFSLLFLAGSFIGMWFEATHIGKQDTTNVATGYYLTSSMSKELKNATTSEKKEKVVKNVAELSSRMASFGVKTASDKLSKEGQLILNRYYKSLKEFGVNIHSEPGYFFDNPAKLQEYLSDLKRIESNEKDVTEFYSLNTASMKVK